MPLPNSNAGQRWTYADYLNWNDDRWEIIDGIAYAMSPAPGRRHQELSGELFRQISNHLKGKHCKIFAAPFDVRLAERPGLTDDKVESVVQPDLLVVCDSSKLDERGCNGPPDLIIEITSPSTGKNDLTIKFDLYQRHGVKEYWIVHPAEQTLMVFKLLENGMYSAPGRFGGSDQVDVPLLGELVIALGEVFAD